MPLDTTSLIVATLVGGVIGFFFSSLTSVLAFIFQLYRDSRSKEWDKDKIKQEDARKIITRRLELLEEQISGLMPYLMNAQSALESVLSDNPDVELLRDFRKKFIIPITNQRLNLFANTFYFNDDNLDQCLLDIFKVVNNYIVFYDKFPDEVKDKGIDADTKLESINDNLQTLMMETSGAFENFFTRLDVIKIDVVEQLGKIKKQDEMFTILRKIRQNREKENKEKKE